MELVLGFPFSVFFVFHKVFIYINNLSIFIKVFLMHSNIWLFLAEHHANNCIPVSQSDVPTSPATVSLPRALV